MHLVDYKINLSWQSELKNLITDPEALLKMLALEPALLPAAKAAARQFPLRTSRSFVARMHPGDPFDPLLQQVLPIHAEIEKVEGFSTDPLKEGHANPLPGLLHKYHGRVLLTVTGGCGVHCRYCFRRHFPYEANTPGRKNWNPIFEYIQNHPDIHEVILSGGDPLVAPDAYLVQLIEQLAEISHLRLLRIHTRLPIVIPQRITSNCVKCLTHTRLKPVMVIHCNHANEINKEVADAMHLLTMAGVTLLNQTVLLKNINDNGSALAALSYRLFEINVLPYYLHVLDKVQGAAHFELPIQRAKALYWKLREQLPGYLVPTLVREEAGATSKIPVV